MVEEVLRENKDTFSNKDFLKYTVFMQYTHGTLQAIQTFCLMIKTIVIFYR
ncbi:hypothetical protein SAMN04488514_10824 [Kriegella aquimaris]|uniref:Uncharacterized protein n=1 Tax=Kriegella aquimaris TaxID=192904 RepID=A0A1G9SM64_9FLAO|nr:hypothetical protein SAMN04488514_10824 [Kriegella aquimaris]